MKTPQVGQYLYASCAGEDYGRIIGVGQDLNHVNVLDIELYDPQNLMILDDEGEFPPGILTTLELPENTPIIIRGLQWRWVGEDQTSIHCRTPGNGCFRCTKLFILNEGRTKF